METKYISISTVSGISDLPSQDDFLLLSDNIRGIEAKITANKDIYYTHLRRLLAIGVMSANMFMPATGAQKIASAKERFEIALAEIKSRFIEGHDALLIVEISSKNDDIETDHIIDLGEIKTRIQLFDTSEQETQCNQVLNFVFAGISLSLPDPATDTIQKLGNVSYAIEPETGIPIYNTNIQMSASFTSKICLDKDNISEAGKIIQRLNSSPEMENVIRLLSISSDTKSGKLMSFLSAWNGLEMFIQAIFKSHYEPEMYALLQSAAPAPAQPFVERMQVVMESKYNIRDKFIAVASIINSIDASEDISEFKKMQKIRNDLAHSLKFDLDKLPNDAARSLFRKYVKLHLAR